MKGNLRLSYKKHHEVVNLSAVVHSVCEQRGVKYLIDIGSGLVRWTTYDFNSTDNAYLIF